MTTQPGEPTLTVLTPTYNRCSLLPNLYASLEAQTEHDFEWIVIDDGSTDGTDEYIASLTEATFPIKYLHLENGGKCRALNRSHSMIDGRYVIIVDSDDTLTPDAVATILADWRIYDNDLSIGIINFERGGEKGEIISKPTKMPDYYIDDDIHFRVNKHITGDRAETLRSELLCKYSFPEFPGENFMNEGWLWNHLALDGYKTVYRNKVIYTCEYLEGGLTKSGRALRMRNPLGLMEHCKSYFHSSVCIRAQLKETLLYWVYALCSDLSWRDKFTNSGRPWKMLPMLPFGWVIYRYWKWKYMD